MPPARECRDAVTFDLNTEAQSCPRSLGLLPASSPRAAASAVLDPAVRTLGFVVCVVVSACPCEVGGVAGHPAGFHLERPLQGPPLSRSLSRLLPPRAPSPCPEVAQVVVFADGCLLSPLVCAASVILAPSAAVLTPRPGALLSPSTFVPSSTFLRRLYSVSNFMELNLRSLLFILRNFSTTYWGSLDFGSYLHYSCHFSVVAMSV